VKTVEGNKTATTSVNVVGKRVTSVSLDKQDINLRVGEGEKLTASVLPGDADDTSVEWSSDNPKIVKVDANGNVTAVGEGTAKIRATTYDGGFVAECQVTATPIPVTSIKLSESKLTLDVGAAKTLTATVAPTNATYKDVVWSSSKKAVATVDSNGKITAKSPGLAVIAATTADGNKKATCEVAVRLPSPAIKSVATAGDRKVKVVWAGVKGATGYSIYRAKSANGNPVKIGDASSSSTSYTASVGYSKYWYSVVALYGADARCNSNASSAVAFNTLLPPTMTEISSNGKSITVEWKKASGATKYYIYRAKGKGEFAKVKTTEKTSWTDKNVEKDVIYTYRVKSWRKSSDGNELLSDTFSNNKRIENSLAFIWPIKGISNGDITSEFGDSDNRNTSHKGIDIGVKTGTTVVAAAAGTVEVAMYGKSGSGYGGFGRVVVIDHGNGIKTLYAHNKEWTVEKGDKVKQGQKIAVSNNSGDSKGAHLHFEVRVNGERKNPRNYLPKL
jgi:murein DD-endopeptidase MepM/ murein hydrolase activator NlpD